VHNLPKLALLLDPRESSSYSDVPCSTLECETAGHPKICRGDSCRYIM
jgi:hypothetical protein